MDEFIGSLIFAYEGRKEERAVKQIKDLELKSP